MGVPILESTDIKAGDSETLDDKAMAFAGECLRKVQQGGAEAVAEYAQRFGELTEGQSAVVQKAELKAAYDSLDRKDRECLDRVAARVKRFATCQRNSIKDMETDIPGGKAGHTVSPVDVAGCCAPGGRYLCPPPSS